MHAPSMIVFNLRKGNLWRVLERGKGGGGGGGGGGFKKNQKQKQKKLS